MPRGLESPVATSCIRYPEATDGWTEFVGVSVLEQLDCALARPMIVVNATTVFVLMIVMRDQTTA